MKNKMTTKYKVCKKCLVKSCCTHICEDFRQEVLKKHNICISQGDALKESGMNTQDVINMIDEHIGYNKQYWNTYHSTKRRPKDA